MWNKKKKPPKRPYRSRAWAWIVLAGAALCLASSGCTMYAVAKKEIVPALKQTVVAVGPHLVEAAIYDAFALLGLPFSLSEELAQLAGIVKPEAPAKPAK